LAKFLSHQWPYDLNILVGSWRRLFTPLSRRLNNAEENFLGLCLIKGRSPIVIFLVPPNPRAPRSSLLTMSDDVENQRITIVPTQSRRRDQTGDHVTLMTRRTLSIHAPPTVQPSARLPIEFRTLSLHLEHTKKSDHSASNKGSKGAVRGPSGPPVRVRRFEKC
jgi:hypothetical protein